MLQVLSLALNLCRRFAIAVCGVKQFETCPSHPLSTRRLPVAGTHSGAAVESLGGSWILALSLVCVSTSLAAEAPVPIASRLQLFVDARLIESFRGTHLRLHPPQPREVVFTLDAPWEGPMSGYVTMMQDDGLFRMYYRGGGETTEEVVCMATSRDGVEWERPNLGLVEFRKSKANNILLRGQRKAYWEAHNFTPFKDTNPATPAESRYKALTLGRHTPPGGDREKALLAMHSPDGVHWKHLRAEPVITKGSFDSQNTAFWDANRREYVAYVRDGRTTPDGRRVRSVLRATSKARTPATFAASASARRP